KLRRLFANTCKCPVPCQFKNYVTSVSQAVTSPLSVDRFLAQTDQSKLKSRYDSARDVTHRLQKEKRQRLYDLIRNLERHFEQVRNIVLNQIENKINEQRKAFDTVIAQVEAAYRSTRYLYEYQNYIVDKNFVRARDAINERTLSVVCLAYQEFSVQVELAIQSLGDNITEPGVRRVLYLDVARKLEARRDITERAFANYTQFKNALQTGQPIFNYRFREEPRENSYLIAPVPMFHAALNSSLALQRRAELLGSTLIDFARQLSDLKELASKTFRNGTLNATELHLQSVQFMYLCRSFSQSKDMFMNDVPEFLYREMQKRDEQLAALYDQFQRAKADFDTQLQLISIQAESLTVKLDHIKSGSLGAISRALNSARIFLFQGALSKRSVAEEFLREDIMKTQGTLKNFFNEVRSRGHAVYDDWITVETAAIALWTMAIKEENLRTYYEAMKMTHMLVAPESKAKELREWCRESRDLHDLRRVVNNVDSQFSGALSDMLEEMASFRDTERIDGRFMRENILHLNVFYKELSYEQITQQEAYGVFAFLCDIGGSMGLFLGASVITVFEVMDLLVFTYLGRLLLPKPKEDRATQVDF
ncbi:acid-sensing ion channel 4-like, partial [Elysia marginata]